jgi:NhaP-type Na+/H+ or K+/H+ antiporter
MLLVPFVAFLIAESVGLSGFIVLIISAFFLSLYGTPNMEKERADSLGNILRTMSYVSRNIACLFMGISFPLHFGQTEHGVEPAKVYLGAAFAILSGFVASLVGTTFVGRSFKSDEKKVHVI